MSRHKPLWKEVETKPDPEVERALEYLARLSRRADEIWVYVGEVRASKEGKP